MNRASLPWIAKASHALAALLLVAVGCDNESGSASDTDATSDATNATTMNTTDEPTSTDGTTDSSTDAPTTGNAEVGYVADIQPIWDANCTTGCHVAGGTAEQWFVVTPDVSYDSLVGKQSLGVASLNLIEPGDRDKSYLWHKINNTHIDVGGSGMSMPPPPAMLASGDIEKIGAWIDAGANP